MSNGEDDKKTLNMSARIFVANVPVEEVTTKQIKERFMKYGAVSDVYLGKTFAFVQFDNAACAEEAIASESGTFIGENKIDCSLAKKQPRSQRNEDEDDNPGGGGGYGGGVGGGGYGAGGGGFGGGGYGRGGGGGGGRGRGGRQGSGGGGGKFRDRSPMRPGGYDDRYEGRRYDSYERQGGRAGYGGDEAYRDPYYRDSDRDSYRTLELDSREKAIEKLERELAAGNLPPLNSTEKETEMRIFFLEKERAEKEKIHESRLQMLKEEHAMRMEILRLEKQAMELKILKLMKTFNTGGDSTQATASAQASYYQQQAAAMLPQAQQMTSAQQMTNAQQMASALTSAQRYPSSMSSTPVANQYKQQNKVMPPQMGYGAQSGLMNAATRPTTQRM